MSNVSVIFDLSENIMTQLTAWAGLIGRLRMAAPCASLMDADD